jgi:hypothetical protein
MKGAPRREASKEEAKEGSVESGGGLGRERRERISSFDAPRASGSQSS